MPVKACTGKCHDVTWNPQKPILPFRLTENKKGSHVSSPCPSWASAISLLCFSKASIMAFLFALSWNKNHFVSKSRSGLHPRQHLSIHTRRTRAPSWPRTTSPPPLCRTSWFLSCRGRTCGSSLSRSNTPAWLERKQAFQGQPSHRFPAWGELATLSPYFLWSLKYASCNASWTNVSGCSFFCLMAAFPKAVKA